MDMKKNLERILAGEMILTFFKGGRHRERRIKESQIEVEQLVDAVLPMVVKENRALHGEALLNRLITEAWQRNALSALRIKRNDFLGLLEGRG